MICKRRLVILVSIYGLAFALPAQANPVSKLQRLTEALSSPSFKVRLQAVILIGKQRLVKAIPAVRKALNDKHDAVKAAAVLSLGKLGDEGARKSIAMMLSHKNILISRSAEKALITLDKEKWASPTYLVAIDKPHIAPSVEASRGVRMVRRMKAKLVGVSGVVMESGEVHAFQGAGLKDHLKRRGLSGIMLLPKLVELTASTGRRRTSVFGKVSILVSSLENNRLEYNSGGEANAWIEGTRIPQSDRIEMESTVVDASLDAAVDQVLSYLASRVD